MRLLTWLIGTSCLLLMALFVALFAIAHQAEAADDLFKGKTVTVYVGYDPGGTNDIVTRLVAANIGPHLGDRAVSTESPLDPTAKNPFDVLAFTWIGSPTQETLVCVSWQNSKIQSVEDALTKDYVVASPGLNQPAVRIEPRDALAGHGPTTKDNCRVRNV